MTCGMLPWGVRGRAGVPWHLALQTPTTYALPSAPLTHALPPLVRGGDGGWRRACNVGMMADMVGIEGLTYADPRYDAGMRSPPLPHVIASSRPKADAARRGSGRVGREGGEGEAG